MSTRGNDTIRGNDTTKKKSIQDEDDFSGDESDFDMNEMMQKGGEPVESSDSDSDNENENNEDYNEQASDADDLENDGFNFSEDSSDSDEETMRSRRKKTIYDMLHDESEDELDLGDADNYKRLEIKGEVIVDENERISKPVLTKYERVGLLTTRTAQLKRGAKPMIKSKDIDINTLPKNEIARLELKHKVIPLVIQRPLPTLDSEGRLKKEQWKITELEFNPNDL